MERDYKIEACVETLEQAVYATSQGVDQLELCRDLHFDGLTPDLNLALAIRLSIGNKIPIKIMIRNRSGDFQYKKQDLLKMKDEVLLFKSHDFGHFVFGAITSEANLDLEAIHFISQIVGDEAKLCIHKAIDYTNDLKESLKSLSKFKNVHEVLSSGGKTTALEGSFMLKEMIAQAPKGIHIIAAGKITNSNRDEIHKLIGAPIYHGRKIV